MSVFCKQCDKELVPFGSQKNGSQLKCPVCGLFTSSEGIHDKVVKGVLFYE